VYNLRSKLPFALSFHKTGYNGMLVRSGDTTAQLAKQFSLESQFCTNSAPQLNFKYPLDDNTSNGTDLENQLPSINTHLGKYQLRICKNNESVSMIELEQEFQRLLAISQDKEFWKKLQENERITIEKYKLAIMLAVQNYLLEKYKNLTIEHDKPAESEKKPSKWLWVLYGALMGIELTPMIWGGFLGVVELLGAIPQLTTHIVTMVGIVVCSMEAVLYYSVMGPVLQAGLGLSSTILAARELEIYNRQLQAINLIDTVMSSDNKIGAAEYNNHLKLLQLFGKNIVEAKTKIEEFKEPSTKKGLRWLASGVNILLNIGGGYFICISLLRGSAATAALIGTPAGWAIIGFITLGQFALRYVVRSNGMMNLLNPSAERHNKIYERVDKFKLNENKYQEILGRKKEKEETIANNEKHRTECFARNSPHVDTYKGSYTNSLLFSPEKKTPARVSNTESPSSETAMRYGVSS